MIVITNQGEIPLHGIRLLGQSKKSREKIGQFGTGLKEAIALCLRKGLKLSIYSGIKTKIEFSIQKIDDQNEVCFKLIGEGTKNFESDKWHGMGFSPSLGIKDWTSEWQILREIICNAIDEGDVGYYVGNKMAGSKGRTTIVLSESPEMLAETVIIKQKILQLNDQPILDIIKKDGLTPMRVYCKGIFITELKKLSLFDYNLNNLKLNESRNAGGHEIDIEVTLTLFKTDDNSVIQKTLSNLNQENCVEIENLLYYLIIQNEKWKSNFHSMYRDNGVLCETLEQAEKLKKRGYSPVGCQQNWISVGRELHIPTWKDILTAEDNIGMEITEVSYETTILFNKIWGKLIENHLASGDRPAIKCFRQVNKTLNGLYLKNMVYIHEDVVGSKEEEYTIVEELAHHCSQSQDYSPEVQKWLVNAVGKLVNT